jgi:lipopolysaccharide biosynthesis glycosyltransferase
MHVACATDDAYAPHAAAMLHSLARQSHGRPLSVHVLHGDSLNAVNRERLGGMLGALGAGARFHHIDDTRVRDLPDMGRISRVMWYRVFLPELLPAQARVLYLDCDVLVRHGLQALFERGMETRAIALGLADTRQYFNSGVLLLNLSAWRQQGYAVRILDYARANAARLVWPDQDALNVVLAGRWRVLHPRWNCQNSLYFYPQARAVFGADAVREALADPAIVHFEGGHLAKPWHYLCKHPLRQAYLQHRRQTPWPEVILEGRSLLNRLLRLLPWPLLLPVLRLQHRLQGWWGRQRARVPAGLA